MLSSPIQNNEASKYCHQELSRVSQWWFMDSSSCKTLAAPSSILRSCGGFTTKHQRSNLNLQSLSSVLNLTQWLIPTASGSSPNKSINADSRSDGVFLKARCIAGYLKRYIF